MIYRGYKYFIFPSCIVICTLAGDVIAGVDTENEAIAFIDDYIERTNNG